MNIRLRLNVPAGTLPLLAATIALLLLFVVQAYADGTKDPNNSYKTGSTYGAEWQCNRGFSERDGVCQEVKIPEHGFLDAYGDRWKCERGYRRERDECVVIVVPENAFLSEQGFGGKGWECERGFLARGDSCVKIDLPANAYLSSAGRSTGWVCDRGFKKVGNQCERIVIPDNAHLGYDGNDWECDKPFERRKGACVK